MIVKDLVLLFLCILNVFMLNGQSFTFTKQWDKLYGGTGNDAGPEVPIIATPDNGYLLVGFSDSENDGNKSEATNGGDDFWIVKIDSDGNKLWDKSYGGTSNDALMSAVVASDGGYFLAGRSYSGIGGDKTEGNKGAMDYWIVKIDAAGNKEWDKTLGGSGDDIIRVVAATRDGGCILGGASQSPISGDKTEAVWGSSFYADGWVVKVDAQGNKQWDRSYGGTDEDDVVTILQTDDGGYLLGCYSNSDSSGNKSQNRWGQVDYWIIKTDSSGNKIWDKIYGGTSGDVISTLKRTGNGNYIIGGYSSSDAGGNKSDAALNHSADYWLVKIDSEGNKLWDRSYGGKYDEESISAEITLDGGFLLSGGSTSPISGEKTETNLGELQSWIVKTDSAGNKEWDKTIFLPNFGGAGSAIQTDNNCYLAFISNSQNIGGYKSQNNWDSTLHTGDYWVLKFCMDEYNSIGDEQQTTDNIKIQVYPNPFSSDISISLSHLNEHEVNFTITDVTGKTVYQRNETNLAASYTKMLDLSYLPNGIYFVAVEVNGERTVRQVVKQ